MCRTISRAPVMGDWYCGLALVAVEELKNSENVVRGGAIEIARLGIATVQHGAEYARVPGAVLRHELADLAPITC